MLPDLPALKEEIQRLLDDYLRQRTQQRMGVFGQAGRHIIHEGDRMHIVRADGTEDISSLKSSSAELEIKLEEIPDMTVEARLRRLDGMADEMARQMSGNLFQTLDTTLDKAGQTIDRKGRPLDAETILETLAKLQMDFDEEPKLSLVIPPALKEKANEAFRQIESDPVLRRRHDDIIESKRRDWRAREAARKLVG